ncbi:hypothetical protein LENED_011187 [Lentinula edodes]|uniref:Uncharacterized protein n=1 Tax=Lentinula edodes TaxID=5353 RepID=A0A1Q3EPC3_LENED|nr:hypothetical protein LENED_011187 [Lentinula edodes]
MWLLSDRLLRILLRTSQHPFMIYEPNWLDSFPFDYKGVACRTPTIQTSLPEPLRSYWLLVENSSTWDDGALSPFYSLNHFVHSGGGRTFMPAGYQYLQFTSALPPKEFYAHYFPSPTKMPHLLLPFVERSVCQAYNSRWTPVVYENSCYRITMPIP